MCIKRQWLNVKHYTLTSHGRGGSEFAPPCIRRRIRTCGELKGDPHFTHGKRRHLHRPHRARWEWFLAFSPEFPEGNGQGLTEAEALDSLRESILLLMEDRREDARASLGSGEKLVPLALA